MSHIYPLMWHLRGISTTLAVSAHPWDPCTEWTTPVSCLYRKLLESECWECLFVGERRLELCTYVLQSQTLVAATVASETFKRRVRIYCSKKRQISMLSRQSANILLKIGYESGEVSEEGVICSLLLSKLLYAPFPLEIITLDSVSVCAILFRNKLHNIFITRHMYTMFKRVAP